MLLLHHHHHHHHRHHRQYYPSYPRWLWWPQVTPWMMMNRRINKYWIKHDTTPFPKRPRRRKHSNIYASFWNCKVIVSPGRSWGRIFVTTTLRSWSISSPICVTRPINNSWSRPGKCEEACVLLKCSFFSCTISPWWLWQFQRNHGIDLGRYNCRRSFHVDEYISIATTFWKCGAIYGRRMAMGHSRWLLSHHGGPLHASRRSISDKSDVTFRIRSVHKNDCSYYSIYSIYRVILPTYYCCCGHFGHY